MTNADLILELLDDVFPGAYCDDCLSSELSIQPRQQANQLGRQLASSGITIRHKGVCSSCKKPKTTNSINKAPSGPIIQSTKAVHERPTTYPATSIKPVAQEFDIEHARTEIVRICHQIWIHSKEDAPPHSISVLINSLKGDDLLPSHQANMMLTLCGLRNVYVYEDMKIGSRELDIAKNALNIIQEWWTKTREL